MGGDVGGHDSKTIEDPAISRATVCHHLFILFCTGNDMTQLVSFKKILSLLL